jgi:sarcosine oxidase/L-pipecolate oxidase
LHCIEPPFRRSGVLVIRTDSGGYGNAAYKNDIALGAHLVDLPDADSIRSIFPVGVPLAMFSPSTAGYLNRDGGWAFAAQGVAKLLDRVKALGAKVVPGQGATELAHRAGQVIGVNCAGGKVFEADVIVIAAGSWTACSFPELDLGTRCLATG